MIELSIKVKDDTSTMVEKDVLYHDLMLSKDDRDLQGRVNAVVERFKANSTADDPNDVDVTVNAKMVW
jgi:hypothetical protein